MSALILKGDAHFKSVRHLMLPVAAVALGLILARWPLPLAAAVIVAAAVLVLVVARPMVGLALALLAGPFGALEKITLNIPLLDSGQLLLLLALGSWLAQSAARRRIIIPFSPLNIPLSLFIGVAALSLLNASSLEYGVRELIKWVEIALVMWMVKEQMARCKWQVASKTWAVVGVLLLAGVVQALIGAWQFGLRGDGPEHFLILGRFYRAYGTFEQPNPFGGYMALNAALGLGALAGLVAYYLGRRTKDQRPKTKDQKVGVQDIGRWSPVVGRRSSVVGRRSPVIGRRSFWLIFIAGCAALTTLGLVLSWSRGAWLGFAAAGGALAFFWPRRQRWGVLVVVAAAVLLFSGFQWGLVPEVVAGRLSNATQDFRLGDVRGVDINDSNYAVLERLAHWQAALDMARSSPWLGVGFGNYEPAYSRFALINWPYPLGHAHNYYLNILAETGVLGLAAYLVFWAAVFWQTLRLLRHLDWPQRGIALGLLAAWTALSVHHLVDKLYVNNIYVHLGAMLGLLQLLEGQVSE